MPMIIHKKYFPDIDIDKSSFIYDDIYILIRDEYICDVLKCMNVPEIDVDDFYDICICRYFKSNPEVLEIYALKLPHNAYYYAKFTIRGRFELGESIIATHAEYSYGYTFGVLNDRFELGESIIATDTYYSYYYARHVLKGRFELSEHVILNSKYADKYRELFL